MKVKPFWAKGIIFTFEEERNQTKNEKERDKDSAGRR